MASFTLDDGEQINSEAPDTFWIPPHSDREALIVGDIAKLIFRIESDDEVNVERMWVIVKERTSKGYIGILDNDPICTKEIASGLEVEFQPEHIIQIYNDAKTP